jgi:hypothetical protein
MAGVDVPAYAGPRLSWKSKATKDSARGAYAGGSRVVWKPWVPTEMPAELQPALWSYITETGALKQVHFPVCGDGDEVVVWERNVHNYKEMRYASDCAHAIIVESCRKTEINAVVVQAYLTHWTSVCSPDDACWPCVPLIDIHPRKTKMIRTGDSGGQKKRKRATVDQIRFVSVSGKPTQVIFNVRSASGGVKTKDIEMRIDIPIQRLLDMVCDLNPVGENQQMAFEIEGVDVEPHSTLQSLGFSERGGTIDVIISEIDSCVTVVWPAPVSPYYPITLKSFAALSKGTPFDTKLQKSLGGWKYLGRLLALLMYKYTGIIHNDLHSENVVIVPNRRSPFGDYTPLIIDCDSCYLIQKNTPGICMKIIEKSDLNLGIPKHAAGEAKAVDAAITYFASRVLPTVPKAKFCIDDFWQMEHVSFYNWWCSKITETETVSDLIKRALHSEPVLDVGGLHSCWGMHKIVPVETFIKEMRKQWLQDTSGGGGGGTRLIEDLLEERRRKRRLQDGGGGGGGGAAEHAFALMLI